MKRKIIALLLTAGMMMSAAACGGTEPAATTTAAAATTTASSEAETTTAEAETTTTTAESTSAAEAETTTTAASSEAATTTEKTAAVTTTETTTAAATTTTAAVTTTTATTTAAKTTAKTTTTTTAAETTTKPETTTAKPPQAGKPLTANEVAREMGVGLNLGNTMEAYEASNCEKKTYEWIPVIGNNTPQSYETCWGAVVTTQEVINGIKAEGFDTVRIPVFWGNMMKNDGTYTINADYIERVREIVDYCHNADLYAVVNIHHFDEFIIRRNSTAECKKIFTNLWTQIAEYFKDYPYTLVFEGYNEYLGGKQFDSYGNLVELDKAKAYEMTNTLNQAFVDAVRSTGGNNAERVLIVSGYWTNIDNTTSPSFKMPKDTVSDRLMVSVHYVDNAMYWSNRIGGKDWLDYTDGQIKLLNEAFSSKNIPVFLGETSVNYPSSNFDRNAIYKTSSECVEIILRKLAENGFVPVIWDTNDNFYSRTKYRIKSDSDRAVIKAISEELRSRN